MSVADLPNTPEHDISQSVEELIVYGKGIYLDCKTSVQLSHAKEASCTQYMAAAWVFALAGTLRLLSDLPSTSFHHTFQLKRLFWQALAHTPLHTLEQAYASNWFQRKYLLLSIATAVELNEDSELHAKLATRIAWPQFLLSRKADCSEYIEGIVKSAKIYEMFRTLFSSTMAWHGAEFSSIYWNAVERFLRSIRVTRNEDVSFGMVIAPNLVYYSTVQHDYVDAYCSRSTTIVILLHEFSHFLMGMLAKNLSEFHAYTRCHSRHSKLPKDAFRRKLELDCSNSVQWGAEYMVPIALLHSHFVPLKMRDVFLLRCSSFAFLRNSQISHNDCDMGLTPRCQFPSCLETYHLA